MARNANRNWNNGDEYDKEGADINQEQATRAVLQDIRDELQSIRRLLLCPNIQRGLIAMHRIDKRLSKHYPLGAKK